MTPDSPARAVIKVAIASLHAQPAASSPQVSQRLAGHGVAVLEEKNDWRRVRGDDGYEGWVHVGCLAPVPARSARRSAGSSRISLGCVAQTADGARRALPLGALLGPGEVLQWGEAVDEPQRASRFPREAGPLVESAQAYFGGAPYLWGGITPWGADCSGFVQSVFQLHGISLPRDSAQQAAAVNKIEGLTFADVGLADLIFFSERGDRVVTHVGLGIGGGRMVHVALGRGGYAVERVRDKRDSYVAKLRERFLFAARAV